MAHCSRGRTKSRQNMCAVDRQILMQHEKTFQVSDAVKIVQKLESMLGKTQFRPVAHGIDTVVVHA